VDSITATLARPALARAPPRPYTAGMLPPKRIVRGSPRASSWLRERVAAEGSELARVKHALAERGLAPLKRMGQNFLVN
jgi:hypothetical protein